MVIGDEVKETSAEAIARLKEIGVKKVVMLTGDSQEVAEKVGLELGMDEVRGSLLPHQKVEESRRYLPVSPMGNNWCSSGMA